MAKQGLAALVGGFQESREFVSRQKREKQVAELFGRENLRMKNLSKKQQKDAERMRPGEYSWWDQYEEPQNWLQKFVGKFGRGQPEQAVPLQPLQMPADPGYMQRTQEYGGMDEQMGPPSPPVYKHGGAVRQLRKKYEHGGKAI
ncbi:MAG TPA: hypothetical protein ENH62_16920, partial [Marinobacter sp.]|nr:hypothetical protein [Marinobacter sp.]